MSTTTLSQTRVSDAMHAPVISCQAGTPLREVARLMARARVHALLVVDEAGEACGVVTALDLVAAATDSATGAGTAGAVAATEVLTVPGDASLRVAAQRLVEHEVNHALVKGPDGRIAGIVSSLDLARAYGAETV